MKVILVEDLKKVGKAGDVIKVSNGFARNYLLPRNYAIFASKENLIKVESIKKDSDIKKTEAINQLKALALRVEGTELHFNRKSDESGHLFGSVSENDISLALVEKGFDIKKNMIDLEKHLKEVGTFNVQIALNAEIKAEVKVVVNNE